MTPQKLALWIAAGCAVVIGVTWLIVASIQDQNRWEAWCKSEGGRVADHTTTGTVITYDSKGNPGVGVASSTTYYCLSADGRILDVR